MSLLAGPVFSQDVNQEVLLDCKIDKVLPWPGGSVPVSQKLYLNTGETLVEYNQVAPCAPDSPSRKLLSGIAALFEKLKPQTPYDVRSTNWYHMYFQMNVQQIQDCCLKASSGSAKWREKPFGSFITWLSGTQESDVVRIVLLGVDPPSVENVATIKEFQALHEDCLQAQTEGKIPADAQLTFTRVSQRFLAERVEEERAKGRCVIVASCHEDQRDVVLETYKKLLTATSHKETLYFTALKRDAPKPLPAESRRWKMMVLCALLPTICVCVSLIALKCRPKKGGTG